MKMILAAATALMLGTAAFAAEGDTMAPAGQPTTTDAPANSLPASATPTATTCADLITQARGMKLPADPAKAKSIQDEIAAADDAGDDATCRTHAQNALTGLSGG